MHYKNVPRLTSAVIAYLYRLTRFSAVIAVFYLVYEALLAQLLDGSKQIIPLFALWLFTAYIVLPRAHRLMTKYYLPNYYVGRVRSPAGFLSDPINLAINSSAIDLHNAMKKAGWTKANKLTISSLARTIYCVITKKSYPAAPVGNMFLFSRVHDFAYEKEVGGTPAERHHVRFWKTPHDWYLPGGYKADWLAAATYDTRIGLKIATGQIDHLINERDFMIDTLSISGSIKELKIVKHFTDAYHDRNNGGDRIKTDGSLPFITLIPS
jgi:LssY C-terminus